MKGVARCLLALGILTSALPAAAAQARSLTLSEAEVLADGLERLLEADAALGKLDPAAQLLDPRRIGGEQRGQRIGHPKVPFLRRGSPVGSRTLLAKAQTPANPPVPKGGSSGQVFVSITLSHVSLSCRRAG